MLGLPPTTDRASPAAALLDALDPPIAQARRWSGLLELGAMGTLLLLNGDAGPSFVLPWLRTTAGVVWTSTPSPPPRLLPPRHSIKAAMLALSLYPSVPTPVLNQATMLPLTILSDGRWATGRLRPEAADTVLGERAELTPAAWSSLTVAAQQRHPDDVDLRFARALLLGRGLRLHRPAEVSHVIPASIDGDERHAVAEAVCDAIACRASLAVADDLVSALLAARDLYTEAGAAPLDPG